MVIKDFSGNYLNFESSSDGDIYTILDEGTDEYNETLKKEIYNIKVQCGNSIKKFSPNQSSGKSLQEAFGMDSKNWIGKQFEVIHADKKLKIRPLKVIKV